MIQRSAYRPSPLFRNAHFNTIYSALVRRVPGVRYQRERLPTPDGDFLDLDWSTRGGDRLLIVVHGLEGSADRPYVRGMIRYFNERGWDGLGMNFRGCSGEPNLRLRSYHMGETEDLGLIVRHALERGKYRRLALVGFSLGGNVVMKYLGEGGKDRPREVAAAVALSVPCHIASANREIDRWYNFLYLRRFLRSLNAKMAEKAARFPGEVPRLRPLPRSFQVFDDHFTGPIHGFRDARDYWESTGSLRFIPAIDVPTLLINARDDTFLSHACYPVELAQGHDRFYLEIPRWGGHVGFYEANGEPAIWSEKRAFAFIDENSRQ
jgi:predicted alpha/beta-fold hydrolase